MNIAIIGTGNVGGALATQWAKKEHKILLGVKDINNFKGINLLQNKNTSVHSINEAASLSDIILLAIPPSAIFEILGQIDTINSKIIIDATNAIMKSPEPYKTVYHVLADKTKAKIVKCFNTTGFENMLNPVYHGEPIDMFMAGDSIKAKDVAKQLAFDAGFGTCWDFGNSEKVELLEKFALSWINLAILQSHGRELAFRVVKR